MIAKNEIMEIRSTVLLLCPDNDCEAHMILKLAERAGIATLISKQPHGAKLELESNLESELLRLKKEELWVVETPGIEKENELIKRGINLKIIDHHTYNDINRLIDPLTGLNKPSSLEQFIILAKISDEEIQSWGFDPKTVHGIGIMDARYAVGLREAGYTKEEMAKVFKLQQELNSEFRPEFNKLLKFAEDDWKNRTKWHEYLIISSKHGGDMRTAISQISILEGVDTTPLIISIGDGSKISVQNVGPEVINKLKKGITNTDTYTFGSGHCWGVDNKNQDRKVTLDEILHVLE